MTSVNDLKLWIAMHFGCGIIEEEGPGELKISLPISYRFSMIEQIIPVGIRYRVVPLETFDLTIIKNVRYYRYNAYDKMLKSKNKFDRQIALSGKAMYLREVLIK